MEIAPGLHRLEMPLGSRTLYQHLYIGDRVVVVDTGIQETPAALLFPYLDSLGRDPSLIDLVLISHADADHFGGNAALKKRAPGAMIASHELDARWISDPDTIVVERYNQFAVSHGMAYSPEVTAFLRNMMGAPIAVDLRLKGGETYLLSLGRPLHLLHLPGHTRGHLGVYDPTEKTAVFTDAILWKGLPDNAGAIVMPPTYCHTSTYRTTIQQIENLDIETLCLSHYPLISGHEAVADFVSETRRFFERAETAVICSLADGAWKSLKDIIACADPLLGPFGEAKDELAYPLLGHLTELMAQGRLEAADVDGFTHWHTKE